MDINKLMSDRMSTINLIYRSHSYNERAQVNLDDILTCRIFLKILNYMNVIMMLVIDRVMTNHLKEKHS